MYMLEMLADLEHKVHFCMSKRKTEDQSSFWKKSHLCISTKTHDRTNSLSHWVRTWNAAGCKISGVCLPPHRCCEMFLFALTVQCGVCFSSHPLLIHELRNATVSPCVCPEAWALVAGGEENSPVAQWVYIYFSRQFAPFLLYAHPRLTCYFKCENYCHLREQQLDKQTFSAYSLRLKVRNDVNSIWVRIA